MRSSSPFVMLFALCALGCGHDEETSEPPPSGCEWRRDDGVCVSAGLPPDMPCPPAEWLREDGVCVPAGVPPDGCAEGFVHDGDRGCLAILPEDPCAPGLMAVPGETTCREVAPCATGTWGDIAVEPDTEYVDASYAGMDSDGSALKPWTTIQAGVDAASPSAIVAIAEGSYLEDVIVSGKPVRLWGVCPALVEIVGTGGEVGAVQVFTGATGTELENLAIRGAALGFVASGALDVSIERAWVHDNAERGIDAERAYGATSITVRASLIEGNRVLGIYFAGIEGTVEASMVRDTLGRGVSVERDFATGAPGTLVLRSSLVEQSDEIGVFVGASEAVVEATVIRDTQPGAGGLGGQGVSTADDPATGAPAKLVLLTSLVERNRDVGVFVGASEGSIERSVIRDTRPDAEQLGHGVGSVPDPTSGTLSKLVVLQSLVERSNNAGVFVSSSEASVEASVIRDSQPDEPSANGGRGVNAQADAVLGAPSTLVLRSSLVERSHEIGVFVARSEATIEASIIRDSQPNVSGIFGRGVLAQLDDATGTPSTLFLRSSIIEQSHEAAVAIMGSVATIDACLLRDTRPSPAQGAGDGVIVFPDVGAASATITATRIHQSALAAVAAWGARAAIGGSSFSCQAIDLDSESGAVFEDLGGNLCGCPEPTTTCKAATAGLTAPAPLEPTRP